MRHQLCRPASPSAIIHAAIASSGDSLEYVAAVADIKLARLRRILDGARVKPREVRGLAVALGRWSVALGEELERAQGECDAWDRREKEMSR